MEPFDQRIEQNFSPLQADPVLSFLLMRHFLAGSGFVVGVVMRKLVGAGQFRSERPCTAGFPLWFSVAASWQSVRKKSLMCDHVAGFCREMLVLGAWMLHECEDSCKWCWPS